MGSAIALTLVLEHPDDLVGLILIGAGAKLGVDSAIVEGLRTQPMRTIEQTITPMSYFKIDLGLGREARAALSFANLPIFLNDYLACDGFDVRPRLSEITAKTLIICGENDRMTPPKWSTYLNQNIRSSTIEFVKDAGHMVPLEKPETCAGLIQGFLSLVNP
jgi:pimeloyl-ACP methyl ester carboxylesterase